LDQSALLVLTAELPVESVSLSGQTSLGSVSSASELLAGHEGWFFDNNTHTLFVSWVNNSTSTLRALYKVEPSPPPSYFPETLFLAVFTILLAVEVVVLAYLRSSRRNRSGRDQVSWKNQILTQSHSSGAQLGYRK